MGRGGSDDHRSAGPQGARDRWRGAPTLFGAAIVLAWTSISVIAQSAYLPACRVGSAKDSARFHCPAGAVQVADPFDGACYCRPPTPQPDCFCPADHRVTLTEDGGARCVAPSGETAFELAEGEIDPNGFCACAAGEAAKRRGPADFACDVVTDARRCIEGANVYGYFDPYLTEVPAGDVGAFCECNFGVSVRRGDGVYGCAYPPAE